MTKAACRRPCATCPWRGKVRNDPAFAKISTTEDGKTVKWYSLQNLRRLWGGLRKGVEMSCHATDEGNPRPDGWKPVPENVELKMCIGALILKQREYMRFDEACAQANSEGKKDAMKRYKATHPKGMTREGFIALADYMIFSQNPEKPDLNEPDISHPDLVPWETQQPSAQKV